MCDKNQDVLFDDRSDLKQYHRTGILKPDDLTGSHKVQPNCLLVCIKSFN